MPETTDPQPDRRARLEAVLTERFTELGNPFSEMRRHEKGPDGWPASHPVGPHQVAEVLRELLAAAVPSAPADRAALCHDAAERITAYAADHFPDEYDEYADQLADVVRRMAVEAQQPEAEAHEPLHRWRVEILDGDEWMPASRTYIAQSLAVDRYQSASEQAPAWADGESVQRRLVRETTTYTVELPAAVSQPGKEARS